MFNSQKLIEKLGYERWVLRESVLAVEKAYGIQSDSTVIFQLDGIKNHTIELFEELGSNKRIEVLENLSPLLFVTCYKALDMIFEWILEENEENVPYQFHKKIKLFESSSSLPGFKYPLSLNNEQKLIQVLFSLYKKFAIYRNKIIHGNWGTNINGDLKFSFEDRGKHFELNVSFEDIICLSEVVSLVADELISESSDSDSIHITIKFLLDKLKHLHESNLFNISKPRHYKVEFELGNNSIINIKEIYTYLKKQNLDTSVTFTLYIFSKTEKWLFPWQVIRYMDSIDITNNNWGSYKI